MDIKQFWHLIDSTRGRENRTEELAQLLELQVPEEIVRFRMAYDDALQTANTVDLWGAAHVLMHGCSDAEFYEFRQALIELGEAVFTATVQQPDELAGWLEPGQKLVGLESLDTAAQIAWCNKSGQNEEEFFAAVDAADSENDRAVIESGEQWNFNDAEEVRHRLPRIAAIIYPSS